MDAIAEKDLSALEKQLATYQEKAGNLDSITEEKLEEAALFVGACDAAMEWIEADRVKLSKPLYDQFTAINKSHNTVREAFNELRTRVANKVSDWNDEQARVREEQQRLALEEAARIQREKDEVLRLEREALAKQEEAERIAREQAELAESSLDAKIARAERELSDLQESLPEVLSVAQQRQVQAKEEKVLSLRSEKSALEPVAVDTSAADATREKIAKLEAEVAVPVVAQVIEQVRSTIKTGNGSVTFRESRKDWVLPGWDKEKKYSAMDVAKDPAFPVKFDILPPSIQWLLKVSVLNSPALNQSYKNRESFPRPFGEGKVHGGTVVRSK